MEKTTGVNFTKYSVVILLVSVTFLLIKIFLAINYAPSISQGMYLIVKYGLVIFPFCIASVFTVAFHNNVKKTFLIYYIVIEILITGIIAFL